MGALDRVASFLSLAPFVEARPSLVLEERHAGHEPLAGFSVSGALGRTVPPGQPWRTPTVQEALGVPAILRAVTLIANTVGVLSMDAYRNGAKMAERPALVVRPNPLTTPRVFFRDSAWYMATYGEVWYWVAKRDLDGAALSLVPVPPYEVVLDTDP